ncbi:MAG: hypothetical protein HDT20_01370 [Oscillibacter sp.]|nr:hypothetical protein [Oscillibacter sp.]
MKSENFNFHWFEKEDRRKSFRASVSRDGKLHLGKSLRENLPPFIRIGFDSNAMVLAIADGHGAGISCPACGVLTAQALCTQLASIGLRPPVYFHLTRDEPTGYLLGRVVLHRKTDSRGRRIFDTEQLLIRFRSVLDDAVHLMAKSTPLADRKSAAVEALCTAAQDYEPGFGDLETYLKDRVKLALRTENRQYTESFSQRSLDQSFSVDDRGDRCLYDTIADAGSDGMDTLDRQLDMEQFCDSLTSDQRNLIGMLQDGFKISEITDILGISERNIRLMALEIAQLRRKFETEA